MILPSIFFVFALQFYVAALDIKECNRPLGMTSRAIKDDQISASSSFDLEHTGPQNARLRLHTGGGAWCPMNQINATTKEWIQISFGQEMLLTAVATEGRYDEGRGMEFATAYRVEYWRSSLQGWAVYRNDQGNEVVPGNTDTRSQELRILDGAIVARRIRILPVSNTTRTVCLRLELYGCPYKGILESYTAPEGSSADGLSLLDFSYDGATTDGTNHGGLGKMYDGVVGAKNFEHLPQKWVGWRMNKLHDFVPLSFTFSEKQNISAVLIHTNNMPSQQASVFTSALLSFSPDGINFSRREVHFTYPKDKFETARWVRIPVPDRIAKVLEVKLFFDDSSSWLLVSEVKFETNRVLFEVPTEVLDDITVHQITEDDVDGTGVFGTISLIITLLLVFCFAGACGVLAFKKRDRVKAASPPPNFGRTRDVRICMENGTIKRVTQSTYQMAVDNVKNSMLENTPIEVASEYAEPEILSSDASLIPLLTSFQNAACEYSMYASSHEPSTLKRNPLSSTAKYSEYGEVYATTLPEIDRCKLEFVEKIGQGEFGEVHLCQLEQRLVAVKKLHGTSPDEEFSFQREIRVLGALKHPNVVEVVGVSTTDRPLLCIMEYMENGDLKAYLAKRGNIDTPTCIAMCTQLAAGLAYLESCNFVHRDIAARNCLVDSEGTAKITDFGMARSLYSSEYYRVEGRMMLPIRWMAPETLFMGKFSTSSDVWAFGVTMWEVFSQCREKPYAILTDEQVILNLQQADSHLQTLLSRPPLCPYSVYNQILLPCWRSDPSDRPSFEHLHLQLQSLIHSHPLSL